MASSGYRKPPNHPATRHLRTAADCPSDGVHLCDLDVVRAGMQLIAQALIDLEAAEHIGADRRQRTGQRITHRNARASAPRRRGARRQRYSAAHVPRRPSKLAPERSLGSSESFGHACRAGRVREFGSVAGGSLGTLGTTRCRCRGGRMRGLMR